MTLEKGRSESRPAFGKGRIPAPSGSKAVAILLLALLVAEIVFVVWSVL